MIYKAVQLSYSIYFKGKKLKEMIFLCIGRKNIVESYNVSFLFSLFFSAT